MLERQISRQELISGLAKSADVSEASVTLLLQELARVAVEELMKCGSFVLPGVGFMERRESPEATATNPSTGERITIPAKINLRFEFASRFKQAVLSLGKKREGTLTTSIWKAPRAVLEAIERDFSAKDWDTLDAKAFPIDGNFTALLDEYADLFAYVLKTEGEFDPTIARGLTVGYVSPESVQDRAAELEKVHLDALEKAGLVEPNTSKEFGTSFERLKGFMKSAAAEHLGLIIVTHF
jgi:nucleoid DNA-binding protein